MAVERGGRGRGSEGRGEEWRGDKRRGGQGCRDQLRGEKTWISCGTLVMILPEETVALKCRLALLTTIPLITYIHHARSSFGGRKMADIH